MRSHIFNLKAMKKEQQLSAGTKNPAPLSFLENEHRNSLNLLLTT